MMRCVVFLFVPPINQPAIGRRFSVPRLPSAMVTKLKFKGEKHKKRKRADDEDKQGTSNHADDRDDGWVNASSLDDISTGPLFITFASSPPIAVASDALGRVHAAPIKVSDEDYDLGNAEPDDVRQVWIATRLVDSAKISLKTPTGKFLSCDKVGILSASKEAIGPQEEWQPVQQDDGWAFQNVHEKFMCAFPFSLCLTVVLSTRLPREEKWR
jgi:protein FRG1